jgi:hypothetical protein
LIERRLGLLLLCIDDIEPAPCRIERRPGLAIRGKGFLMIRIRLLKPLERSDPAVA